MVLSDLKNKKKLLIVNKSFYPAYKAGGPARSLTNLSLLYNKIFDVSVFTRDRDSHEKDTFHGVISNSWNTLIDVNTFYESSSLSFFFNRLIAYKIFHKKKIDILYLNSFFDLLYTVRFLFYVKLGLIDVKSVVIAPRGELSDGAFSINTFKKNIYLKFYKSFFKNLNVYYHFTSVVEYNESMKYINSSDMYLIAPNISNVNQDYFLKEKVSGEIKICFLSRISPKKNLHLAIDIISRLSIPNVVFNIYGPVDDSEYWSFCKSKISKLGSNIICNYHGSIQHDDIGICFKLNHIAFLPTLNENYGHTIVESMKYCCVPLISDQTPWGMIKEYGAGVFDNSDINGYVSYIESVYYFDYIQYNNLTKSIFSFIEDVTVSDNQKVIKMFDDIL